VPGQDGGTIYDQIPCPDQSSTEGSEHAQNEERLGGRCSGGLATLALLGGTLNAWPPIMTQRQAAGQGQSGPSLEPVVQILVRQPPQRAQECQQQGLLTVGAWCASWSGRQGGRTSAMSQAHRQTTERQQMQGSD